MSISGINPPITICGLMYFLEVMILGIQHFILKENQSSKQTHKIQSIIFQSSKLLLRINIKPHPCVRYWKASTFFVMPYQPKAAAIISAENQFQHITECDQTIGNNSKTDKTYRFRGSKNIPDDHFSLGVEVLLSQRSLFFLAEVHVLLKWEGTKTGHTFWDILI